MLSRKKKPKLPALTGKTIDMTRTYWGHNFQVRRTEEDETYKGWIIVSPGVSDGDMIKWTTEYGCAYALVTHVEWCVDPGDMYFINCVVIDREGA